MNSSELSDNDQHIASYKEDFTPDVEAGLRRLHGRIEVPAATGGAKVRRLSRRKLFSVAAAVLLLLGVGSAILLGEGTTTLVNDTGKPMAITLPDGTEVLLQQGSELAYAADYNETDRLIDLEGQAYFEVMKDAERPFLVNTKETELRVTGTAFNLRVEGDDLEVEVSEGAIELHRNGKVVPVKAHHCGIAKPGKACKVMAAKELNRHAWRTGIMRFEAVALPDVIKTICNNYGLEVAVTEGCDFPFSGVFSQQDPISILKTIAEFGNGELNAVNEENEVFELSLPDCE